MKRRRIRRKTSRAVLLSLAIQGAVCYLIEYFAANFILNNGYTIPNAGASGAPLGDMMVIVGTWLFGSVSAGKAFMLVQAFTVFLALIGTTLSCLSTGARVTYAMGRDEEVPSHFGLLHGKTMSPHKAIWALAVISAIIGIVTVTVYMGGQSSAPAALDKHNIWYSFGIFAPEMYDKAAQHAADRDAGQQLRHVPALHVHLLDRHGGLQGTPYLQQLQACGHPGFRLAGKPCDPCCST